MRLRAIESGGTGASLHARGCDDGGVTEPTSRRRPIRGSAYGDDDGSPDPTLRAALRDYAEGATGYPDVLAALADARLLVPVVALLGEVHTNDEGLATDKSSDMAAVLLTAADGRRALLAFTGTDTLRAWNADARPVPVRAALAAATAIQEGADALLVDVGTSAALTLTGPDLPRVAAGWRPVLTADDGWAWLGSTGQHGPARAESRFGGGQRFG